MFFESEILAVIYFFIIAQLIGFLFEGSGISLFVLVKRIPDMQNIFRYAFQLLSCLPLPISHEQG